MKGGFDPSTRFAPGAQPKTRNRASLSCSNCYRSNCRYHEMDLKANLKRTWPWSTSANTCCILPCNTPANLSQLPSAPAAAPRARPACCNRCGACWEPSGRSSDWRALQGIGTRCSGAGVQCLLALPPELQQGYNTPCHFHS